MRQYGVDVSIIIVNYNVKYFLEQALLSVLKATQQLEAEIFVVDNNSIDDSVAMVRSKFPQVKLIANPINTGFSVANNQAIHKANGKYILLLNPDTVVNEDTFDQCFAFMETHPKVGALGVKMIDGSGKYLPESKRGFPSPFVAFCKTFGLSRLFPKSPLFNRYYLGHLDKNENHPVDVLAGAYMWMRKSVLDEIGLLDEQFFMYGEDIDLSYRVTKAGYQNYYLASTSIIHYKGESTKKGSLNYVRTFYNAMILFAQKHFQGRQAQLFILMLKAAIYFRATLTLLSNLVRRLYLPILDSILIYSGLLFLKRFWGSYHFNDSNYYPEWINYTNFPLYTLIWIVAIYFSGNYDRQGELRRLVRGILFGSLVIAAIYGFLPTDFRASRALIVLGTIWTLMSTTLLRVIQHFIKYRNFDLGESKTKNTIIVGTIAESQRVVQLLNKALVRPNLIGTVAPSEQTSNAYLSTINRLADVVQIYKVEEIIFCSKDVSANAIMGWMTQLGPNIAYKIVPEESLSIIGSHSKNTAGELYTIDIKYSINQGLQRRNKRFLDVLFSVLFLLLLPFLFFFVKKPKQFLQNIFHVLFNKKTWVGYAATNASVHQLPKLKTSVLSVADQFQRLQIDESTKARLNFLYAKDYRLANDLEIISKNFQQLGQ